MRVELSKALSILSHEVRGSLGVLQGYLRMLRDGVADPVLTARMLEAMQDATTRISGVAREASELSAWTEGRRPEGRETGTIRAVLEQAVNEAGATDATVSIPEELAAIDVPSEPPGALGRALAAILTASRRESPGVAFELAAAPAPAAGEIVVRIRPVTGVGDEAAPAPFDFGRGGMGLALVLASHVLDDHGARLTIAGSDRSRVTVHLRVTAHLQRHGGSQ